MSYQTHKTKFKAGNPGDLYNVFPKRKQGSSMNASLRAVCSGIKKRIRKETDPAKKAMWAEIGIELNNLLMEL
jgi:hypothetical protein